MYLSSESLAELGVGLYEVLAHVDLLITDTSSVCIDFLVTRKPQILFFPDFEAYKRSRGFLLEPVEDYLPGPLLTTFDELQQELDRWASGADSDWMERRERLRQLLCPQSRPQAAEELLDAVNIRGGSPRVGSEMSPPRVQ